MKQFSKLIKNQTLRIDPNHARGDGRAADWDSSCDVHIDKTINEWTYEGAKMKVILKIPINRSEQKVSVEFHPEKGKRKGNLEVPKKLEKEISDALSDESKLETFVKETVNATKDFQGIPRDYKKSRANFG